MSDVITVSSGVTSSGLVLTDQQTLTVLSGGTAIDTTATGLSQIVVSAGGVMGGAALDSGSLATVASGGTAWNTTIMSGGTVLNDGTTIGTTLFDGGTEAVGDPAALYDPPAAPPAVASDTTVRGGTLLVNGGGTAIGTVVDSGGTEYVGQTNYLNHPPLQPAVAVASDTTISGGAVFLYGDGTLADGISFLGGGGFLYISGTFAVPTTVRGFDISDRIEFAEMDYTSGATATFDASTDVLTLSNGFEVPFTVQLADDYTGAVFGVSSSSLDGGTVVTVLSMPCFAAGSRILTQQGEIAVEHLAIGDCVTTVEGEQKPITWIGHRRVDCRRHPEPGTVWPVRVAAHAFAQNVPHRDLLLSPDHAVFADGVLIPVKHLVNDGSVRQIPLPQITYFHIALDQHAVILAEGLPAETYLDTGDGGAFANAQGPTALHPVFGSERGDVSLVVEALGYAPLRVTGPDVAAVKLLLAERIAEGSARRVG